MILMPIQCQYIMPLHIYHFRIKGTCAPNTGRNDLMGNTMGGNVVGV